MTKRVLVTGDLALDMNIYHGKRSRPWTPEGPGTWTDEAQGGAYLLHKVVDAVTTSGLKDEAPRFKAVHGIPEGLQAGLPEELRGYCLWESTPGPKKPVWRLSRPLGYGGSQAAGGIFAGKQLREDGPSQILVLDDGNLGFRSNISRDAWPSALTGGASDDLDWVILKMADPLCEGDLWRACLDCHAGRMIAVVNLEDVRQMEVRVTKGISWERTALDLVAELDRNPALSSLRRIRFLVVRIGFEGALVVQRLGEKVTYTLVFDPGHMEGDWREGITGSAMGFMSTLTAGIASRLAHDPRTESELKADKNRAQEELDRDAVLDGVKAGLFGMRTLLLEGHGVVAPGATPGVPFEKVGEALLDREARSTFADAAVPVLTGPAASAWSFLVGAVEGTHTVRPLFGHAHCLALKGPGALHGVPYQSFGKLLTMDRKEIESLRNLRQLIWNYKEDTKASKPLSIAVFGPPGSGKSFGIKQIAKGILGKDNEPLEFNLSQFSDPKDLIGALHQVRDAVLSGTTPLVFWDEFDSKGYLWLQYLLAPMQDGAFQEGQLTHPIGKCIFVFAGGTSWDYENFGPQEPDKELKEDDAVYEKKKDAWAHFKLLKGPDFLSRLSGYLNVLGPNPRSAWKEELEKWIPQEDDDCFPLRRAILLRAMYGLRGDTLFKIDPGLLSAFMEIPRYKHGARSMEKILEQAKQRGRGGRLRRSDLPPAALLELHADYDRFMEIAERDMEFAAWDEVLAPSIHAYWYKYMVDHGYDTDLPEAYADLSEASKADNLAAARRLPAVLALAGLKLVPEGSGEVTEESEVRAIINEKLELLSEVEHDGWMEYKLRNGWVFNKTRNDGLRRHHLIIPYQALSEGEKGKDRNAVQAYPEMAALAGYRIVRKTQA